MKTDRLLSLVRNFGLYDEKVDIAMRISRTKNVRAKQDDLRLGGSSGQAVARFGDQGLIDYSHDRIVDLAADNSYHASVANEHLPETAQSHQAAQIVAPATPHLAVLIAEGTVRPGDGSRHLPSPIRLWRAGTSTVTYVSNGRR